MNQPTKCNIGLLHAIIPEAFPRLLRFWQIETSDFDSDVRCDKPVTRRYIHIEGDCRDEIECIGQTLLEVDGDVSSTISAASGAEVVISGNLSPEGEITVTGPSCIYIGKDCLGTIKCNSMALIWILGDLSGSVRSGHPSLRLFVSGNYRGEIIPGVDASMLYLAVGGRMDSEQIKRIASMGYTYFHAYVRESDVHAGIYPDATTAGAIRAARRSHVRWVVGDSASRVGQALPDDDGEGHE